MHNQLNILAVWLRMLIHRATIKLEFLYTVITYVIRVALRDDETEPD